MVRATSQILKSSPAFISRGGSHQPCLLEPYVQAVTHGVEVQAGQGQVSNFPPPAGCTFAVLYSENYIRNLWWTAEPMRGKYVSWLLLIVHTLYAHS